MDVLEQILSHFGTPEILNIDQGSQYTREIYTQRLKTKGSLFLWMEKNRQLITFALNMFGEVQNAKVFI